MSVNEHSNDHESDWLTSSKGPSLTEFALAKTQREIRSNNKHVLEMPDEKHLQLQEEHSSLMEKTVKLIRLLASHPSIVKSSAPLLWHPDLHLGNIFVRNDDPTIIEGIIDWQSTELAPLFLQARVPAFLKPPKNFVRGIQAPQLPENFDSLDEIQQQRAMLEKDLASRWKIYEMYTLMNNRDAYDALGVDRRLWEVFARCSQTAESVIPLRANLIRIAEDWSQLDLPGECPFSFTEVELQEHGESMKLHEDRIYLQTLIRDQLDTDDDGWVPLHEWESTRAENQRLLDTFIETMAEELTKDEAIKMWPFFEASLERTSTT